MGSKTKPRRGRQKKIENILYKTLEQNSLQNANSKTLFSGILSLHLIPDRPPKQKGRTKNWKK